MCWWATAPHQEPNNSAGAGKRLQGRWESGCRNTESSGVSGPSRHATSAPRDQEGPRPGAFTLSFEEAVDLHAQLLPEVVYLLIQVFLV